MEDTSSPHIREGNDSAESKVTLQSDVPVPAADNSQYVFETKDLINTHIRNEMANMKDALVDEVSQKVLDHINKSMDNKIELTMQKMNPKSPEEQWLDRVLEKVEKYNKPQY